MQNVLVIDDERDVRDAIKRVLERAGYSVRTTGEATDALAELRTIGADVVITDIIMPKIDGVKVIESIRKEFPAVRIIAISGGGNFGVAAYQPAAITTSAYLAAAERAGAHWVLTKPFDSIDLLNALERAIGAGHA